MQVYEYAVIRLVPNIEREEFINVGVIIFSKSAKYIQVHYELNAERIAFFCPEWDLEQIENNLVALKKIALGKKCSSPLADEDLPERFRWLTAVRSSSIQTSRPHPGLSENLEETSLKLFQQLVKQD